VVTPDGGFMAHLSTPVLCFFFGEIEIGFAEVVAAVWEGSYSASEFTVRVGVSVPQVGVLPHRTVGDGGEPTSDTECALMGSGDLRNDVTSDSYGDGDE
jgi:hypothetical protein